MCRLVLLNWERFACFARCHTGGETDVASRGAIFSLHAWPSTTGLARSIPQSALRPGRLFPEGRLGIPPPAPNQEGQVKSTLSPSVCVTTARIDWLPKRQDKQRECTLPHRPRRTVRMSPRVDEVQLMQSRQSGRHPSPFVQNVSASDPELLLLTETTFFFFEAGGQMLARAS